jgi:hypothetical protein
MLETMQIVKDSHLKLLQRTPFWPLLEVFHNGTISKSHCEDFRTPTLNIIQTFNPETTCFHFGTRDVSINTEDISQILGLPQHGEAVQFVPIQLYKSDFTDRHFKGIDSCKLNHKCIHDLLIELLNGKEQTDIEDVVRLTLMELFITFLFAQSSTSFALMKYCDEFDKLSRYSWAEAVGKFLNKYLKPGGKLHVEGCVLLIPVSYIIIIY